MHGSGPRHERFAETFVVRVATSRKHDSLSGSDQNFPACNSDARAFNAASVAGKLNNWRVEQDRHVPLAQTVEKPADKRIAHHKARAALIFKAVNQITRE